MSDYAHFGEWVKHRREALRLTQEELGRRLGYQEDTISRYEREDRFPKNSAEGLKAALEIPAPYADDFAAVVKRAKPVDSLPPAHLLSEAVHDDQRRKNAVGGGSAKLLTHPERHLLDTERAERLIGRDRLIKTIDGYLEQRRPVLIRGFGGTGKTTLAAEAAYRRLEDDAGRSVMWLDVGEAGVQQALFALARPLKIEREVARTASNIDAAALVYEKLAGIPALLIVLDDVWWSFEDFKWFAAHTLPAGAAVLVTSRYMYALANGERIELEDHRFALEHGGLPVLAHYAATSVEALERDSTAAALCDFLGNLPLALEIAGHSMALGASAKDVLDSVAKTLDHLQYPADYGESEMARRRHASVTATLDLSLEQLDDALMRRVFFAFGAAFEPSVTRDLLAGYLELPADRIQPALDGLSRRSLVRLIEKEGSVLRYRVHDVAYRYLREKAGSNKTQQIRFIESCHRYVMNFVQDVNALHAERVNLLHAAAAASETHRRPDMLVDVMYGLTVDSGYLGAYGHDDLLRTRLYEAIRAAEALEERQPEYTLMAHFLYSKLGNIEYLAGRLDESQAAYEGALRRAELLDMRDREIILLGVLLRTLADRRAWEAAGGVVEQIRQKSVALDNDFISMRGLEYIGYHDGECVNFYKETSDARFEVALGAAKDTWERFYVLALKLADKEDQIMALLNLSAVKHDFGQYDDAVIDCEKALSIARENPSWTYFVALLSQAIGKNYHYSGNRIKALQNLSEGRLLFRRLGMVTKFDQVSAFAHDHGYEIID